MRDTARVVAPVIAPRAVVLWALVRLGFAAAPMAIGEPFGSMPPSPIGIVLLCGIVGLIDVRFRGERILWANLGARPVELFAIYGAAAVPAELLLALALR